MVRNPRKAAARTIDPDRLCSTGEASRLTGFSTGTFTVWCRTGRIADARRRIAAAASSAGSGGTAGTFARDPSIIGDIVPADVRAGELGRADKCPPPGRKPVLSVS